MVSYCRSAVCVLERYYDRVSVNTNVSVIVCDWVHLGMCEVD